MKLRTFESFLDLGMSADLPREKGVYAWISNKSSVLVYIGSATGKYGIYGRVHCQHLRANYLEYRNTRHHRLKDAFQLSCPVIQMASDGTQKIGIDKSVFRRAVGRSMKLGPGQPTVDYILEHFSLKYLLVEEAREALVLEARLIREEKPIFNPRYPSVRLSSPI